jgi:hypothetical protein
MDGNSLEDVFGSTPPAETARHPSDVPRLQEAHSTAGYREGLAVAKATSVQAGFDEGFGLGATLGLEAGRILGVLEGIVTALPQGEDEKYAEESARFKGLVDEARAELGLKSIFGEAYWNADGTWKYPVEPASTSNEQEPEVLFADIARTHPIIKKWNDLADEETSKMGVSAADVRALLERNTPEEAGESLGTAEPRVTTGPRTEPLDW